MDEDERQEKEEHSLLSARLDKIFLLVNAGRKYALQEPTLLQVRKLVEMAMDQR